jgi:hypothetical protein
MKGNGIKMKRKIISLLLSVALISSLGIALPISTSATGDFAYEIVQNFESVALGSYTGGTYTSQSVISDIGAINGSKSQVITGSAYAGCTLPLPTIANPTGVFFRIKINQPMPNAPSGGLCPVFNGSGPGTGLDNWGYNTDAYGLNSIRTEAGTTYYNSYSLEPKSIFSISTEGYYYVPLTTLNLTPAVGATTFNFDYFTSYGNFTTEKIYIDDIGYYSGTAPFSDIATKINQEHPAPFYGEIIDQVAIDAVIGSINALPAPDYITYEDAYLVNDVNSKYNALKSGEKSLVTNTAKLNKAVAALPVLNAYDKTVANYANVNRIICNGSSNPLFGLAIYGPLNYGIGNSTLGASISIPNVSFGLNGAQTVKIEASTINAGEKLGLYLDNDFTNLIAEVVLPLGTGDNLDYAWAQLVEVNIASKNITGLHTVNVKWITCTASFFSVQFTEKASVGTFDYNTSYNNSITGITENMSVLTFKNAFHPANGSAIKLYDNNNIELSDSTIIGTGVKVRVTSGANVTDLSIVLKGDIDGDGIIGVFDLALIKGKLLSLNSLTGSYKRAADFYSTNSITISNLLLLKKHCVGISTISQLVGAKFTVDQWKIAEITLTSQRAPSYFKQNNNDMVDATKVNPYTDYVVDATFTNGSTTIVRPVFWDGGNTWKCRFAPTLTGTWTYSIDSTPNDTGLETIGSVVCNPPAVDAKDIYKRGFLKTYNNPGNAVDKRYLTYSDGTPFFWLAENHWGSSFEDPALLRSLVDLRVTQGLTVLHTGYHFIDTWYYGQPNMFKLPNMNDFRNVIDPAFEYIANAGIVQSFSIPGSYNYNPTESYQNRTDDLKVYWRYLLARYGAYPTVIDVAAEPRSGEGGTTIENSRVAGWHDVAHYIDDSTINGKQSVNSYNSLMTVQYDAEGSLYGNTVNYFDNEPWLDIVGSVANHGSEYYNTHWSSHYNGVTKPLAELEQNFEQICNVPANSGGRPVVSTTIFRRSAYRAVQLGSFGYNYGVNGIWSDTQSTTDCPLGSPLTSWWGDTTWAQGLLLPGATQMKYLKDFYTNANLPWWKLKPMYDTTWVNWSANVPTGSTNVLAPVLKGDHDATNGQTRSDLVIYYPHYTRNTVKAGEGILHYYYQPIYNGFWYNPSDGTYKSAGTFKPTGANYDITLPAKPDNNDWLFWLTTGNGPTLSETNHALTATVTVDSTLAGYPAMFDKAFAIDGDVSTDYKGWCSNATTGTRWIQLYWDTAKSINRIRFYTEAAYPVGSFTIQYSTNGTTFTTISAATTTGNTNRSNTYDGLALTNVKALKLNITLPASNARINEFEAYLN